MEGLTFDSLVLALKARDQGADARYAVACVSRVDRGGLILLRLWLCKRLRVEGMRYASLMLASKMAMMLVMRRYIVKQTTNLEKRSKASTLYIQTPDRLPPR